MCRDNALPLAIRRSASKPPRRRWLHICVVISFCKAESHSYILMDFQSQALCLCIKGVNLEQYFCRYTICTTQDIFRAYSLYILLYYTYISRLYSLYILIYYTYISRIYSLYIFDALHVQIDQMQGFLGLMKLQLFWSKHRTTRINIQPFKL